MNQLNIINEIFNNFNHEEWLKLKTSLPHRTLILDDINGIYTSNIKQYDKSKSNSKRGIYFHERYDTGEVLYVGQTDNNIAARQSAHAANFKNTSTSEASGEKYRQYIRNNNLTELILNPYYIDLSHLPKGIAAAIEQRFIEYFKPIINREEL